MAKKTKDWWVKQTHMYSRQVGELQDALAKSDCERIISDHEAKKHYNMASAVNAKMQRCQDMLERLVNELTKAQYKGKDEELLKDARTYLQIAVQGHHVRASMYYGDHADNISKSGYDAAKLDKLTAESLKKMRKRKP